MAITLHGNGFVPRAHPPYDSSIAIGIEYDYFSYLSDGIAWCWDKRK